MGFCEMRPGALGQDCEVLRHWGGGTPALTLIPDCNRVRRMKNRLLFSMVLVLGISASVAKELVPDPPLDCEPCAQWNMPLEPFQIFGNTWYVGTGGLSSILITSDQGHILIDGGLPQSAALIAANIRKAGFKLEDVKLILHSHTHYDHAGGIAALQRASGAQVAASPLAAAALEQGGPTEDDPQFTFGHAHNDYAPVHGVRVIRDGETLRVGTLAVTAHFTPGHTPGGTSWTWNSCVKEHCEDVAYADSLNSVSAPQFRFSDDAKRVAAFEKSIATVAALACGIPLAPHAELFDRDPKLARRGTATSNPFIEPTGCRTYAEAARQRLEKRLAEERAQK